MALRIQPSSLVWINSLDGTRPRDPNVRTLIRRQAISKAAKARRRSYTWGNRDLQKSPISQTPCEQEDRKCGLFSHRGDNIKFITDIERLDSTESVVPFAGWPEPANGGLHQSRGIRPAHSIPVSPSSTGYEAMRIRFGFDVVRLSGLTALHVGTATARNLRGKPDRLLKVLHPEKWSYFEYVPSRFGQTRCLDEAICCIAALVRLWLTGVGKPDLVTLELYSRAIKSLQLAINDPLLSGNPDVLCAAQIMSIFELLDPGRDLTKTFHTMGVATLIKLRGPHSYQTDFEKCLLLAQAGPIYTDAQRCNMYCFLEEPAWQAAYQSIISERKASIPFADAYAILWRVMGAIPPLLRNVRSVLSNSHGASTSTRESVLSDAFDLRSLLMIMGDKENLAVTRRYGSTTYSFMLLEGPQSNARYETLGAFANNLMKVERCIVALDSALAVPMEAHAQHLALRILAFERDAMKTNTRAALFLACKAVAAAGVLLTASEWQQEVSCRAPNTVIAQPIFERWIDSTNPYRVAREWRNEHLSATQSVASIHVNDVFGPL
ncbi:MAG: hypothetical protein Q9182_003541 [Xanthomendoza sp. 2 TL-2023]